MILESPATFDASVPDEINYTFGFSAAPHPRLTLGFDFIGRTIRDVFRFDIRRPVVRIARPAFPADCVLPVERRVPRQGRPGDRHARESQPAPGRHRRQGQYRARVARQCGGAVPLTNSGLQPKVTPYYRFRLCLLEPDSRGPAGSSRLPLDYSRIQTSPFRLTCHVNLDARGDCAPGIAPLL